MARPILWALGTVFLVAAGATGFTERFSSRVGVARAPAAPQAASGEARVELSADLQGHFVVHPTLDGRRMRMLVDTGASVIALSHEDATLAGLRPAARDYTVPMATANGAVSAARVRIGEVRIGAITVRGVEAVVLPPGSLRTSLLGMSFLRRLSGFEIAQGRLVLKG